MSEISKLANQHFLEWESRLVHIDEMLVHAHEAHAQSSQALGIQKQLSNIRKAREELSVDLSRVRGLPAHELSGEPHHLDGLKASFEAVGLQLEKVLATMVRVD